MLVKSHFRGIRPVRGFSGQQEGLERGRSHLKTKPFRSRRVVSAVASLAAAGLVLSACSSSGDSDTVEIDFYYPIQVGGSLQSAIDGYIEQFEAENSHIKVTPVYSGNYEQTLASVQSAAQAGKAPAVTVLQPVHTRSLEEMDLITPIGEIVEDDEWFGMFDEAFMLNSVLDDGTVASIPFQRSTNVMYWNKEMFERAGLDPESPPETWDEMVEIGHLLMSEGGADWGIQIRSSADSVWPLQAMAIQNGVVLDSADGTETYYDDPGVIKALENWVGLAEEGVSPPGVIDFATTPLDFAGESVGIIWTTTGQLTNVRNNADFDFGVAPLPAQERRGAPTGGGNLFMMNGISEEEQDAAISLIRFLSSPEIQADWTVTSGYVAPLEKAWELEPLLTYAEEFPQAKVAREQLSDVEKELSTHHALEIGQLGSTAVQEAMTGERTPEEALKHAQEQADAILEEYR